MNPNTLRCAAPAAVVGIFLVFPRFFLCFSFFLFFSVFHLRLCASDLCVLGPAWQLGAAHGPFLDRQSPRERRARALLETNKNRQAHAHAHACRNGARRERKLKTKTYKNIENFQVVLFLANNYVLYIPRIYLYICMCVFMIYRCIYIFMRILCSAGRVSM